MRQVAVALICDEDQRLLTAQRMDHDGQVELLGGAVRLGEDPAYTLERELYEEIGARVNVLGHVASWRTLHLGEPTSFEIFQAEPQVGDRLRPREIETHTGLDYRSVAELRRMDMARALGQVVKWQMDGELTRHRDNGQRLWRLAAASGINGVS